MNYMNYKDYKKYINKESLMYKLTLLGTVMVFIDCFFLYSISGHFNKMIKKIQGTDIKVNLWGAAFAYKFMLIILYYFIIIERKTWKDAFILGMCVYGTFEATNFTIIKDWNVYLAIIDTLWGGTLFALSTVIYKKLY